MSADSLTADIVTEGLRLIREWALPLLTALAGVGVISMALIQAVKDVMPIRRTFHRAAIKTWLKDRKGQAVEGDLIRLATGGDAAALFELPAAGLMGQLTMASRIVLLFPDKYEDLLRTLAGSESDLDIELLLARAYEDERYERARRERPNERPHEDVDRARVRVGHMVERNIDALQISVTSRWERSNKIAAFVVSALVTAAAFGLYLQANSQSPESVRKLVAVGLLTSILAGFVAPVAKDLVTALQNLRKPST